MPRSGTLNGTEKRVLRFTLATRLPRTGKDGKSRMAFVPCVVFKPSEAIVATLTGNTKGMLIGLEGRVSTSKYETRDKQTRYSTDVVVDERNIEVLEMDGSGVVHEDYEMGFGSRQEGG